MKPLNEELKYVSDAPEGTNPLEELVQENAKLRAELLREEADHIRDVAAEIDKVDGLRAELAAAREDTERLDWADKHLGDYQLKDGSFPFPDHPKSVRAAIDAARKGPK